MTRKASQFLEEFGKVATKYTWFLVKEKTGNTSIRGCLSNGSRDFSPLTAYVYEVTGRYFEVDRFDLAGAEAWVSPECVTQIVDASDEWQDRERNYSPKPYEVKLRSDLLQLCSL